MIVVVRHLWIIERKVRQRGKRKEEREERREKGEGGRDEMQGDNATGNRQSPTGLVLIH